MSTVENKNQSTEEWQRYIGEQFRALRLRAGLEQEVLAIEAGISTGAVKNLEGGKGATLKTMIKVCRALGQEEWLMALAPPVTISPIQMLKAKNQAAPRKRVYRPRKKSEDA